MKTMDKMEIIGIIFYNLQIQVRMGYVYKLLGSGLYGGHVQRVRSGLRVSRVSHLK